MGEIVKPRLTPGIVRDIFIERSFNRKIANAECGPHSVQPWTYDNSGCADYDVELGVLFGGSIEKFAKKRKEKNGSLVVMDLMGHGQVLRELPIDSGLAVALGDGRDAVTRESDGLQNIEIICGDILSKNTWKKTKEWVKRQETEGVDIVLCRSKGGYGHLVDDPNIIYHAISQVWDILSRNNGIFAFENLAYYLPKTRVYVDDWMEALKEGGVNVERTYLGTSLTKTPNSPKVLPKIDIKQ